MGKEGGERKAGTERRGKEFAKKLRGEKRKWEAFQKIRVQWSGQNQGRLNQREGNRKGCNGHTRSKKVIEKGWLRGKGERIEER